MGKLRKFFGFLTLIMSFTFINSAAVATYTCPTIKTYSSCNANYYMSGGQTAGNQCIACPAQSTSDGGTVSYCTCKKGYSIDGKATGATSTTTKACSAIAYNITYNLGTNGTNHADNPSTYTIESSAITLKAPTRPDYSFDGWYTDEAFTTRGDTIPAASTGDKTFYAKWGISSYTVTYDCGDGTGTAPTTSTATYGATFTPAANSCSKAGYVFAGWKVSGTSDTKDAGAAFTWNYTEDKTFTATWTASSYTVTYDCGDGTGTAPTTGTATYGATFTPAANSCSKAGYVFAGWKVLGTSDTKDAGAAFTWNYTEDKTFTATWFDKCLYNYEMVNGVCQPCDTTNVVKFDTNGNCIISMCVAGYHPEGKHCVQNTRECIIKNATQAVQEWNPVTKAFDLCQVKECEPNFHIASNACVANTESCALAHGVGEREWDSRREIWGECVATRCDPGYTNDPLETNEHIDLGQCGHCANKFALDGEVAASSYVRGCEIASCMYQGEKYELINGECELICDEARSDETGTVRWDNTRKRCLRECNPGYTQW